MRSILDHLDDRDSILLMYLADELGGDDRARVEQMLAGDAAMREQLEQLRAAHDEVGAALARVDAAHPLTGSEAAAVRHVGRMIRNWQAERLARSPAAAHGPGAARGLRFPYWSYPLAAAAAVTLAFVAWYVNLPEPGARPDGQMAEGTGIEVTVPTVQGDPAGDDEPGDQFASIEALSDTSGLPEVETGLRQLQSLRELMQ